MADGARWLVVFAGGTLILAVTRLIAGDFEWPRFILVTLAMAVLLAALRAWMARPSRKAGPRD